MYENDYMYAVQRDDEYLAHFGVKGMRWGVRKARESGNSRKLGRMYRKAARKLAKLEKRAASGKKYARRAAALGAGAAAAGGLAALGTSGVGRLVARGTTAAADISGGVGRGLRAAGVPLHRGLAAVGQGSLGNRIHKKMNLAANSLESIGAAKSGVRTAGGTARRAIEQWGKSNSLGKAIGNPLILKGAEGTAASIKNARGIINAQKALGKANVNDSFSRVMQIAEKQNPYKMGLKATEVGKAAKGVSNNTYARIAAGAVGAGLAAGAGYNAYRAATTKRAAKKAAQWRSEMNKAFAGTQYANGGSGRNRQGKKRRRRG